MALGGSLCRRPASALSLLVFGPNPEETGLRGYGIDARSAKLGVLCASVFPGALWAAWQLPLFLFPGTYQSGLLGDALALVAFFGDKVPCAVLTSWLCYRNRRSTLAAVLFHFAVNVAGEVPQVTAAAKAVQMLLWLVALALALNDRRLFRSRPAALVGES
ncbi:MAG: CPBP family intramembrane glutamic endopeptidase [Anaerolineae bacterium]